MRLQKWLMIVCMVLVTAASGAAGEFFSEWQRMERDTADVRQQKNQAQMV